MTNIFKEQKYCPSEAIAVCAVAKPVSPWQHPLEKYLCFCQASGRTSRLPEKRQAKTLIRFKHSGNQAGFKVLVKTLKKQKVNDFIQIKFNKQNLIHFVGFDTSIEETATQIRILPYGLGGRNQRLWGDGRGGAVKRVQM